MAQRILPRDYQILFHLRHLDSCEAKGETISSGDVMKGFYWDSSPEGGDFWMGVWKWLSGVRGDLPSISSRTQTELEFAKTWMQLKSSLV